jgi:hypothetical protein
MIGRTTLLQLNSIWMYAIDSIAIHSVDDDVYDTELKKWAMVFAVVPEQHDTTYVSP